MTSDKITIGEFLQESKTKLEAAGIKSAVGESRQIVSSIMGIPGLELGLHRCDELGQQQYNQLQVLLQRRCGREPLQYILGDAPFGPLELAVAPGVFIPRPETESLAAQAVCITEKMLQQYAGTDVPVRVLDLCTGSGALAAYIKHYCPQAEVIAVEKNAQTAQAAQRNFDRYHLEVDLLVADVLDLLAPDSPFTESIQRFGGFNVVVTNPPYVPIDAEIDVETSFDPPEAVFAGDDGLELIRPMVPGIARILRPGGWFGIEHDESHGEQVVDLCKAAGLANVTLLEDLTGRPRFVTGTKPETLDVAALQVAAEEEKED